MPDPRALRVLPRGTALVPDYSAQEAGMRRFHGWKHDAKLGPSYIDQETRQPKNHGGFVKLVGPENAIEIPATSPYAAEYIRHLRDGDLWPADEMTAQRAGVKFDPTFGGEHASPATVSITSEEH